ncbi:hypothetical protein MJ581_16435 [Escherichia coli]|nr:hypothetical protein MJ581_16435 [Escherichia coli]
MMWRNHKKSTYLGCYATFTVQHYSDLTAENLLRLPAEFGCPVWVYDAQIIRRQIAALKQFDVVRFAESLFNIHIFALNAVSRA